MNYIKRARLESGFQQKQVAFELGVSQGTVSEWESGKSNPTLENAIKLSRLYSRSVDYLLGITDDPTPPGKKEAPPLISRSAVRDEFINLFEALEPAEQQEMLNYVGYLRYKRSADAPKVP